jgi:uncharacterized Tic20 family protein
MPEDMDNTGYEGPESGPAEPEAAAPPPEPAAPEPAATPPPVQPAATPPPPAGGPAQEERNLALIAHLLGIIVGFVGALIIWLVAGDDKPYAKDQAKEALNFQITLAIAWVIAWVLSFVVIGVFLMPIIWILTLIFCIIAAMAASRGEAYRYPFALRLIQ